MSLKKHPLLYSISGLIMILAGILCFFFPLIASNFLAMLIGIMLLISGIFNIIACFVMRNRTHLHTGWFVCEAILNIIMAILLLVSPTSLSAAALGYAIILTLLFSSIMEIFYAIQARAIGSRSWGWILALGIICTILSIIMLFSGLVESQIFFAVFAGIFLLQAGITLFALAFD